MKTTKYEFSFFGAEGKILTEIFEAPSAEEATKMFRAKHGVRFCQIRTAR